MKEDTNMQWSHYSQAIFDAFVDGKDNLIVQACPGAGKTTNIKHMWGLDEHGTVYLVFNKHNQIEAEQKLPYKEGSAVLTLNGLGHRAIVQSIGRVTLDDKKVFSIVKNKINYGRYVPYKQRSEQQWMLQAAVQKAKMIDTGEGISVDVYEQMLDVYDLEAYDGMLEHIEQVLEISDNDRHTIDFADQIRLPALYGDISLPHYHNVLGDEVQDFSPIQAMMVSRIHAERYVLVGDKHQSIYGFRGAMNNSMSYLKDAFRCVEYPLSITYRCDKDIVKEAYNIYPDIEAWEENGIGLVQHFDSPYDIDKLRYDKDTIVLCRLNRPLIKLAYILLQQSIPCHVRGRDIGQGLISVIKKRQCENVRGLMTSMEEWYEAEYYKASLKEDEAKMQSVSDKYESIMLFCIKCRLHDSVQMVIDEINTMFEQGRGVCLSTVHKAKGLEAERCYILETPLMQMCEERAKHAWQREQERNVRYVAITRGKHELVYM